MLPQDRKDREGRRGWKGDIACLKRQDCRLRPYPCTNPAANTQAKRRNGNHRAGCSAAPAAILWRRIPQARWLWRRKQLPRRGRTTLRQRGRRLRRAQGRGGVGGGGGGAPGACGGGGDGGTPRGGGGPGGAPAPQHRPK